VSSHAKEKAFREQKTAFSPCGGSEKPAMRVAKEFAKPLIRKKIAQTNPTHHEHEAKWEIPVHWFASWTHSASPLASMSSCP
jgi:hypothetical protein